MKKCIFVIDMVNGFVHEGAMHDEKIMKIVPFIKKLLNDSKNERIIFIADTHEESAIEFNSFPPHCVEGTSESEIIDELKPWVQELVEKNSTNAFHALDMNSFINEYDEYILVGCCSDICVMQFALTLKTYLNQYNNASKVIVYKEGIATYDAPHHPAKEYHEMAIKLMEQSGIKVQ